MFAREYRSGSYLTILIFLALSSTLVVLAGWRYDIFRYGVDLGIFTQVISSPLSGFASTVEASRNHLLAHWSPIIILAWPALRLFGPVGLQYFQAVLVAATLFPLWALARRRLSPLTATLAILVCSIYPILWANALGDFHEMAFVPFLSALLVYAIDRSSCWLAVAAAAVLICTKEDQFLIVGWIAVLTLVMERRRPAMRAFALCALLLIAVVALFYFKVFHDLWNPGVPYFSLHFFDWSHVADGAPIWSLALERLRYAFMILAPLAFVALYSRYALFLLPAAAEIFASHEPVTLALGAHYSALLTGFVLAAFIDGAGNLERRFGSLSRIALVIAAIGSVVIGVFASPLEYWYYWYRRPNAHDAALSRELRDLPADADVGAEDEIFAHLGLDPYASIDLKGQKWFVFDRRHYSQHWHDVDAPLAERLLKARVYRVLRERDGIVILQRTAAR